MAKTTPKADPKTKSAQSSGDLFHTLPRPRGGEDAIALDPYLEKILAIRIIDRYEVETRFGARNLSVAQIVLEGSKEHIQGALFQAYFQTLELNAWYLGRLKKIKRGANTSWVIEPVHTQTSITFAIQKVVAKLAAADAPVTVDADIPF